MPRLVLGSVTETVIKHVQCACLVVRPQVRAPAGRRRAAPGAAAHLPLPAPGPPLLR
jgi:hypothetical protein